MDLSGIELTLKDNDLNFNEFPLLEKLSLANNLITTKSLLDSHIEKLFHLKVLDISGNKLKDIHLIIDFVNKLNNIEVIF